MTELHFHEYVARRLSSLLPYRRKPPIFGDRVCEYAALPAMDKAAFFVGVALYLGDVTSGEVALKSATSWEESMPYLDFVHVNDDPWDLLREVDRRLYDALFAFVAGDAEELAQELERQGRQVIQICLDWPWEYEEYRKDLEEEVSKEEAESWLMLNKHPFPADQATFERVFPDRDVMSMDSGHGTALLSVPHCEEILAMWVHAGLIMGWRSPEFGRAMLHNWIMSNNGWTPLGVGGLSVQERPAIKSVEQAQVAAAHIFRAWEEDCPAEAREARYYPFSKWIEVAREVCPPDGRAQ